MLQPEITNYGSRNNYGSGRYKGMMYRFLGAEHISIETSSKDVHVSLSTQFDATYVKRMYETIFGVRAAITLLEHDDIFADDESGQRESREKAAKNVGSLCTYIVDTDNFALSWNEPDQIFHDSPDRTATVSMRQEDPTLDIRHTALLSAIADSDVKEWLDKILSDAANG